MGEDIRFAHGYLSLDHVHTDYRSYRPQCYCIVRGLSRSSDRILGLEGPKIKTHPSATIVTNDPCHGAREYGQ
jgi:hypothetical protein